LRDSYPSASRRGDRPAAAHRFVRQARNRGAVAGLAGPLAVLLDAGALQALHAELILNIAAAHGKDPTAPERAAELLYLLGVHDTAADATHGGPIGDRAGGQPRRPAIRPGWAVRWPARSRWASCGSARAGCCASSPAPARSSAR
jgi:hypothetical protein